MYDAQNLRATFMHLQNESIRRAAAYQQPPKRSECSVCHRSTDNGATRCSLHPTSEGA